MITDPRPELFINYSPELDLHITLSDIVDYGGAACPDYRFEVNCCWRYRRGSFEHHAANIYFGLEGFTRFQQELEAVQRGQRQEAALHDPGAMVVLRLERKSNKLLANFDVRQSSPPSKAELHVTLEVDYDLFVNKLKHEVERFIGELRELESSR